MRIGKLAQIIGMTPNALRFYEQTGLLAPPQRSSSGQRVYGNEDLERLRFVKAAQASGMTLAEIAEMIASRQCLRPSSDELGDLLIKRETHIATQIDRLLGQREHVRRLRAQAAAVQCSSPQCDEESCAESRKGAAEPAKFAEPAEFVIAR